MVQKVWLNVGERKSIIATIEEFPCSKYEKIFSSPEFKFNLVNKKHVPGMEGHYIIFTGTRKVQCQLLNFGN